MNPTRIPNANRIFTPPKDWDEARNGECSPLPVLDTGEFFQSAWVPDPVEIDCLKAGAPVVVTIWGRQLPPHSVSTMPKPGYVTEEAYRAAFAALRNLTFMCRTASGLALGANADRQLLGSIELAESVVGEIPADAHREGGDPDMLKCEPPQGMPAHAQLLADVLEHLELMDQGEIQDDHPARALINRVKQVLGK